MTAPLKRADEQERTLRDLEALQASKVGRLAVAIAALTQDLAATRRELHQLRRENAQLRRRLGDTGAREAARPGRPRCRESEILTMVRQQQAVGKKKLHGSARQTRDSEY